MSFLSKITQKLSKKHSPLSAAQHTDKLRLHDYFPIAYKLAIIFTLLISTGMSALGLMIVTKQTHLLDEQMQHFGQTVVSQLAESSKELVLFGDILSLMVVNSNLAKEANILGSVVYAENGKIKNQVTSGNWEVTKFYGVDEKNKTVYYQSVEDGSTNRTIYTVKLNGKNKTLLTKDSGTNTASFSKNLNYFINTFSDVNTPAVYTLHNSKGKQLKEVLNNNKLLEKF